MFIKIEALALDHILQVFKEYFNAKYPCTDETNDGSDMPIEDAMKYKTYNYLLAAYNKFDMDITDFCLISLTTPKMITIHRHRLITFEDEREFVLIQGPYINLFASCVWNEREGFYDITAVRQNSKDYEDLVQASKEEWFAPSSKENFLNCYCLTTANANEIAKFMSEAGAWYMLKKKNNFE